MSRGDRVAAHGNLSTSMRKNYGELGVSEYYKKVGSSYRNPHYPGIRLCLFLWLNRWWQMEQQVIAQINSDQVMFFDMACGSGEATVAFVEWCTTGKQFFRESITSHHHCQPPTPGPIQLPRRKGIVTPCPLGPDFPRPHVSAADPFTVEAYKERTSYPCAKLSFEAIAEGHLPTISINIATGSLQEITVPDQNEAENQYLIDTVVCSFALHLIESPSGLFSLLWQLSLKARWLVILAPHKRPEIKEGWGWCKWDIDSWRECRMSDYTGEILHDRVHCRVYRSVNV